MVCIGYSHVFRVHAEYLDTARYDRDASRYHQGVYKRKRADLVGVLDSTLSPLFLGQLKNLHKQCLVQFKQEMHEGMRGESYNFAEIVSAARARCEKAFEQGASEAIPVEGEDQVHWGYDDEFTLLREEMGSVADQCRKDETKKMVNAIEVRDNFCANSIFLLTWDLIRVEKLQEADI